MAKKKIVRNDPIKDPFKAIAQGINVGENEQTFDETPVDIVEFVEGKKFLNQKWNGYTGCRPKILDLLVKTCSSNVREAIWLLGKGSGKDFGASILHLYGIYKCLCMSNPQAYHGLAPSPIYFVNTARNDKQAKRVFFTQFLMLLKESPCFERKYKEPGVETVEFDKNIYALSANSQAFGWLGYNTIQWVGDELAFFLENDNDDESESRAKECWEAAFGSCKTRFPHHYKMIGITTPRYDDDFVMKKFYELKGRDDGLAIQAATWDINPNLTKEDFKHEFIRDYRRTMRDFGAEPSGVIESFWPEPDVLEDYVCETCRSCPIYKDRKIIDNIFACYDYDDCKANAYKGNGEFRDWFRPKDNYNDWVMHFDLAKSKDRIGFCLGRSIGEIRVELDNYRIKDLEQSQTYEFVEEDKYESKVLIEIAAVGFVSAGSDRDKALLKNKEFYFSAIRDKIIFKLLRMGFNIVKITFDQYQSHDMSQMIEDKGVETDLISLDRTDEIPSAGKYAIMEQRVTYPYSSLLCNEAKYLKYIKGKKVDHATGKSKDVWDSFAGTIYNCEKDLASLKGFVIMETDDD